MQLPSRSLLHNKLTELILLFHVLLQHLELGWRVAMGTIVLNNPDASHSTWLPLWHTVSGTLTPLNDANHDRAKSESSV